MKLWRPAFRERNRSAENFHLAWMEVCREELVVVYESHRVSAPDGELWLTIGRFSTNFREFLPRGFPEEVEWLWFLFTGYDPPPAQTR